MATGLAPEIAFFNTDANSHQDDIVVKDSDAHNLLRPETVESLFIMYRLTKVTPKIERKKRKFILKKKVEGRKEGRKEGQNSKTAMIPVIIRLASGGRTRHTANGAGASTRRLRSTAGSAPAVTRR